MTAQKKTKKLSKKAASALIENAYRKVGNERVVPIMSLGAIYKAGEDALAKALAFYLPLSEDEIKLTVEMAMETAIAKVEIVKA